jgi:hypothetical protein
MTYPLRSVAMILSLLAASRLPAQPSLVSDLFPGAAVEASELATANLFGDEEQDEAIPEPPIATHCRTLTELVEMDCAADMAQGEHHGDGDGHSVWDCCKEEWGNIKHDYCNFYCGKPILCLAGAVAIVAPLANTREDINFRNWYQDHVNKNSAKTPESVGHTLGNVAYTLPVVLNVGLIGHCCFEEDSWGWCVGEWGLRSFRAMAVGAPALLSLQYGLGADRPEDGNSYWRPFKSSHGASGHAFVGSIPFLTAASMTDSIWLQSAFVAGSFISPWSRIHIDAHYLSQVILGYTISCLSVTSVNMTESQRVHVSVEPMQVGEGTGVGLHLRF